jgi:hypothetical protein
MIFEKSQLFIGFPYFRLGNLKIISTENKIFPWKYSFRRPLCCLFYSAARGRGINRSPLGTSLAVLVQFNFFFIWYF